MKEWDLHFYSRWLRYFFLVNRVEHQKLKQMTAELPIDWHLLVTNYLSIYDGEVIGSTNQCSCLPKAELSDKNSTKHAALLSFGWVFGIQLDKLEKSVGDNVEKGADVIFTFLTT